MEKVEKLEKSEAAICAVWDFRANYENYNGETLRAFLNANCKKFVFQKEKGDSGYLHWQGRFSLIKKRNKSQLLNMFKAKEYLAPNYLQPTASVNHTDDFFYALKEDTRQDNEIFYDDYHCKKMTGKPNVGYIPVQYRDIKLYPYQQRIVDSNGSKDYRSINCIVDVNGYNGKSTIAAICEIMYGAIDMPVLTDSKELISVCCDICYDLDNRTPGLIFFDMPRAMSKKNLSGFYSAIEQIKKGKLFDIRYKYKAFWIDSPQIWVFSNEYPQLEFLSRDRWKFWEITKDKDLKQLSIDDIKYYSKEVDFMQDVEKTH